MDVVNARAHLRFELGFVQGVKQLEVGTARFEGNHVGVHVVDVAHDVVELLVKNNVTALKVVAVVMLFWAFAGPITLGLGGEFRNMPGVIALFCESFGCDFAP